MMRIIGIDPGSVITGVGVIDSQGDALRYVHHAAIDTGDGSFPERLKVIFDELSTLIQEYQPNQAAVESVFVNRNAASALKLGQARGAAICAAMAMRLDVAEYAPRQVKQAIVGRGAADKVQVQHMVGVLLNMSRNLPADAADALGLAICHAHHRQTEQRLAPSLGARS